MDHPKECTLFDGTTNFLKGVFIFNNIHNYVFNFFIFLSIH